MKTLKSLIEESSLFYQQHPECFKKSYSKTMGGTQTVVLEGIGNFYFDDREYYQGRGRKYNSINIHENLGDVIITKKDFNDKVLARAKSIYQMQKTSLQEASAYRKSFNEAASIIGKDRLQEGLSLIRTISSKTYLFIDNVLLYKAYKSEHVTIEIVSDEYRSKFIWDEWYSAPFASELGMTPDNKDLFIC